MASMTILRTAGLVAALAWHAAASSGCIYTTHVPQTVVPGGVKTVWNLIETHSADVDCGGCTDLLIKTVGYMHPGPQVHYTATTTALGTATHTVFGCMNTPPSLKDRDVEDETSTSSSVAAAPTAPTVTVTATATATATVTGE